MREPFWLRDVTFPATDPEPPARVDVAVVGAGITGLSAAGTLGRAGAHVAVLEAGPLGAGASAANGGTVSVGLSGNPDALRRRLGTRAADRYRDLGVEAVENTVALASRMPGAAGLERGGRLKLALTARSMRALEAQAAGVGARGPVLRLLDRAEVAGETEVAGAIGGLVEDRSAMLHPGRFLAGLAAMARDAGAHLVPLCPVEAIRTCADGFRLRHRFGETRASAVILAVNGYAGGLFPAANRRIFPVGSHVAVTGPLDPDLARRIAARRRTYTIARHFPNYWRMTPCGRLLFGGRASLDPDLPVARAEVEMRAAFVRLLPAAAHVPFETVWGGRLGFTFDRVPCAFRLGGMIVAGGYSGHGLPFAPLLGEAAARLALGRAPADDPLVSEPPAFPLPLPRPWFLPLVAGWYRLLDRLS